MRSGSFSYRSTGLQDAAFAASQDACRSWVGDRFVQGKDLTLATPFQGLALVPFVGQKVRQRRQQERAELSLPAIHFLGCFFLQQVAEEGLRQILRVVLVGATPP